MTEAFPPDDLHPRIDYFWSNLRRRSTGLETEQEVIIKLDEAAEAYLKEFPEDTDKKNLVTEFLQKKANGGKLCVFKSRWDEIGK